MFQKIMFQYYFQRLLKYKNLKLVARETSSGPSEIQKEVFVLNNEQLGLGSNSNQLSHISQNGNLSFQTGSLNVCKQFSEKEIWNRRRAKGVDLIVKEGGRIKIKQTYFKDSYISEVAESNTGTLFFGTFGQGLFIVPNTKIIRHDLGRDGQKLTSLLASKNNDVFISDKINGILHYEKVTSILDSDFPVVERLAYFSGQQFTLSAMFPALFYNKALFNGGMKDATEVNSQSILVATTKGVVLKGLSKELSHFKWRLQEGRQDYYDMEWMEERCRAVAYDEKRQSIYVATQFGLVHYIDSTKNKALTFLGESVVTNDLEFIDGRLFCGTQKHGVLILLLERL